MKYTFEKGEKSTVKVTVTLTAKEWATMQDQAYEKTKGKYQIPGFRKGHVPKSVIEQTYGKGAFYEEAVNLAFSKYYYDVLEKEPTIEPIDRPDVEIDKLDAKGLTFSAVVPVKPEVKLGEYKGIKIDKVEYNVKDDDVASEVNRLLEQHATEENVEGRAAKNGDITVIDYSGAIDGVKFAGGTAEKQNLTLGSGTFIPGFEDQVIGMKIGEERDINVKFPEEYHAENLKGKDSVFHIVLHEIKKKELPELTDEFIKDSVGAESLDAYKKEVTERLTKQNNDRAEREIEDEMVKKISENATVEIPDALIDMQTDRMVEEMSYRLSYQGLKLEDYLKYVGKTVEDYRSEYKPQAESIVKSQLVIEKIISDEKIEATDADVEARIEEMAKAQGREIPDVKKNMQARQLDYVKNEIVIKKFFEFLKKNNTIA